MATNPNITVLDKDGNPIDDRQIEVNGLLPGEGGGGESYWLLDNGTLVPEGSVSEVDLSNIVAQVAEPTADSHAARKTDVDAVGDQVNNLSAGDVGAIPTDEKGTASGVATLDSNGDLDTGQVPSIVITDVYVIQTESELTGLDANQGDVGIATDVQGSWILATDDPSVADNWKELKTDAPPVQDVFGRTGSITAQSGDYDLSQIDSVDVSAMLEGTIGNRPVAGTAGRWYHATDQAIMYRDDGASWTAIAGTGQAGERVPNTSYYDAIDANSGTFGSLSTEKGQFEDADGNVAGAFEVFDLSTYSDGGYGLKWTPDSSHGLSPIVLGHNGGIAHVHDGTFYEMLKLFDGGDGSNKFIGLENEIPGGNLAIESQDGGQVYIQTGVSDDKQPRFIVNDPGTSTDTISTNDWARFLALNHLIFGDGIELRYSNPTDGEVKRVYQDTDSQRVTYDYRAGYNPRWQVAGSDHLAFGTPYYSSNSHVQFFENTDKRGNVDRQSGGTEYQQRAKPTTDEINGGDGMDYVSDGSDGYNAGSKVFAWNDGGTIKTSLIVDSANMTA
ncbi:hypothetical protein [Natrinema versiforme]|uniref:Uncharacterized protein n=1 Tax=Natrinema versiforme JCM 10478 TaxID=1227496 RepID=L9Y537_9EURY|nr:hypothetical protein [Natrinema versiforme]ELY68837.1 hypothetical protein C489_05708 [Natrinema versiforme JCM 10478]